MENYYSSQTMEEINSQDNECFHIIEKSLDWLELYNADVLITEGDTEHIYQRLKQIARENGTLLDDVPEDDYPVMIGPCPNCDGQGRPSCPMCDGTNVPKI